MKACCPTGGSVIDPFAGSGTVGRVAERLGRHATLVERDRRYLPARWMVGANEEARDAA